MGSYTPNYNLYMPSIGEQGWGDLVTNNFETLDTNLNNLQDHINTIDTNIGDGTRILIIPLQNQTPTITSDNFSNYVSYDSNNVYIAQFGENTTFESIPNPTKSCRLMIISVNGNATFSVSIDTRPTATIQRETPPNSETTNTYINNISFVEYYAYKITLTYTANENNSILNMNHQDYLNFINDTMPYTPISTIKYSLSIPHAIAAGGIGLQNGTAGTATNTCNGGGGGGRYNNNNYTGGTGCIFGQYSGGDYSNGYGYGSGANNKWRCALIFVVNGNLTINGTITQIGGDSSSNMGGEGGGAVRGGGGGAPVFIYYTGTYTNNGTINTAGGNGYNYGGSDGGVGGAGGIKVTKITI